MRISRDYFFDMVELVGKAITTARKKPADESWLDEMLPRWMPRPPKPKEEIHKPGQDEFGLFTGTDWASTEDSDRTDLSTIVPDSGVNFGFGPTERRKASRSKHEYGDSISCELWELQRKVRFKEVGVMDALKDLQALCRRLAKAFISEGWANRLTQIIDECSP
jgi:hypothetical protein